ncbi:CDP-diacylglycerol--serine O-phosphatidyltransferase [Porphyromonas sp. COT-239 OH1446]|uniref:CDP-diacylglycerol--serine O-phosphatidyltransferase n=1 Tax=Porphyromonas sp. COT-239 OH1446 TaxID=1515613 RepID=UPI00052CC65E|nr:CDP-diacylglycerol--serine O-phosphatidyltransferase [Porphyromonas sp. COT-239 OH1446]KGN68392.1 hypothetical protein HQ37_06300 [Porphyromonas sp. COT-239 OH1446]
MSIQRHLPNAITCLNLLSGSLAIVVALAQGDLTLAAGLVVLSAVFDFFDGLVARALDVSSPIGKDLDSLADVVSFGLSPAIIMIEAMWQLGFSTYTPLPLLLIGAFAALRLAKFNNDSRQTTSFIGLPVPANALFWLGLMASLPELYRMAPDPTALLIGVYVCIALLSYLMVSEIPMFSFKVKGLSLSALHRQIILVGGSLIFVLWLGFAGLSLSVLLYVALSVMRMNRKP